MAAARGLSGPVVLTTLPGRRARGTPGNTRFSAYQRRPRCTPGGVAVRIERWGRRDGFREVWSLSAYQRCPRCTPGGVAVRRGARREVWPGQRPASMAEPDAPGARGDEAERDAESPISDTELGASGDSEMELLRSLLSRTLGLGGEKPEKVLDELSLEGVSRFLRSEKCKNVVCMPPGSPISVRPAPASTPTCRATTCPTPKPSSKSASSSNTLNPSSPWPGSSTQGSSSPRCVTTSCGCCRRRGCCCAATPRKDFLVPRPQMREVPERGETRHRFFRGEPPLALLHPPAVGLSEGRPAPHHGHLAAGPALRLPRRQGPHQHPPAPHQQGEDGAERPPHVSHGLRLRHGLRFGQGLQKELEELVRREHAAIDAKAAREGEGKARGGDGESPGASGESRGGGQDPTP
ncbi:NAD-dependent protein deacetylase sirtuin-2 isoform X3 [Balearica regulorum gibbericeps]|uniref:NAD-dependent protein deacetylase sirtuin-2 isoform X3 n=1 Tax=Balearica regulorum gibbericeps TaxID=100784 RepID=UPI003F624B4B